MCPSGVVLDLRSMRPMGELRPSLHDKPQGFVLLAFIGLRYPLEGETCVHVLTPPPFQVTLLVRVGTASALAFKNESNKDIRYAMLEASIVFKIFYASLYLDAIILPYYTGIDALSGLRFFGRMYGDERFSLVVKSMLEGISWVFVTNDCVYVMNDGLEGERRHVQLEFDRCDDEIV
uniref:Uncharacterized protein n=1 Tax=Ananas comosus var. bracteatus TaxID=296719 RepID=A0A6V7PXK8_ANACO|nr:unnamed protein product [Ananas comosus var. bracteatus]